MTATLTLTKKNQVGIVTFDAPGAKVNVLSTKLAKEFEELIEVIEEDDSIKALVLISGKEDNFIAGADIEEFLTFKTAEEAAALSQNAQALMDRIASSPKPVVCAINGSCLGGGLETALACHYRIATDSPKTQLGLPEVMLGLLPGAGGTQRLPRLVGVAAALGIMVTGRNVRPHEARKIGLIDHIAPAAGLLDVACSAAACLAEGSLKIDRHAKKKSLGESFLDSRPGEWLAFKKARGMVDEKTRGNYPAAYAIIDAIELGMRKGMKAGLAFEAKKFGELSRTPQSKSLVRLFFLQTSHKKNTDFKTEQKCKTIGILGSGLMGSGVAFISVQSGYDVELFDVNQDSLGRAEKFIDKELSGRVKRKSMTEFTKGNLMSRLGMSTNIERLNRADLIVEAVYEDVAIKRKILAELEPHLSDSCVFASNTSAIPISEIAKNSTRKDRIVGMHYFSPVHKMPLLEIITTKESSKDATGMAVNVGLKQGKTLIVVRDSPGFYTSRILAPLLDEAANVALEGIGPHEIDLYMEQFGFPVGPVTLMDEVGIDVAAHVAKELAPHFGKRIATADAGALDMMIAKNFLGRKSKKGFYLYNDSKSPLAAINPFGSKGKPVNKEMQDIFLKYRKKPVLKAITAHDIQLRIALRMVNEAVLCLQEEVLRSPEDGDVGAVFGLGFPPFIGGPFRYIDLEGADKVAANLKRFADHFGAHFEPAPLLTDMAKSGKKFF